MTTTTITTPAAVQPLDGALRIPVGLICPSPLNPRKRWSDTKVQALAADMATKGQIQPIVVRPNPQHTATNGRPPYEVVVGETRWRAAPLAGLGHLDALLRTCTDMELIQLALAENTKRQDLHPMEEADSYALLMRDPDGIHGYASVQDLAAAVGVSPSYVYQRLKLRNLCKAGRDAFLAGTIDASVALLIARMPDQTEQARATARIVAGFGGEPYSYRQASEFLKREFMLALQLARFDTEATYQVAGPCSGCDKRSGAAPDLFADVASAGDLCQDARCYAAKGEEAHQALLQAARDAGRTVLQGAKARAVLPQPGAEPVGHFRLDAPCPKLTDSQRPLRALLGNGFAGSIVVVDLPGQAPVELVTADAAERAIKARGLLRSQTAKPAPGKAGPAPVEPVFKPKAAPAAQEAAARPSAGEATPPGGEGASEAKGAGTVAGAGEGKTAPAAAPAAVGGGAKDDEPARVRLKLGQLLMSELADELRSVHELPLVVLRLALVVLWADLASEECELVFGVANAGVVPHTVDYDVTFNEMMNGSDGRELGELLALVLAVRDCFDVPETLDELAKRPAGVLARHFGVSLERKHRWAEIAVRGAAVQLDATGAFVAAHSPAGGGADEVTDEGTGPEPTVVDPEWKFPANHI